MGKQRKISPLKATPESLIALAAKKAAEVTAADVVLYMLTTSISNDIVKTFFRPNLSEQGLLKLSRKVTLICGVIGIALAIVMPNILTALQIFYSLMSVSLAVPLFLGLFCRRASSKGAILSAVGELLLRYFCSLITVVRGFGS